MLRAVVLAPVLFCVAVGHPEPEWLAPSQAMESCPPVDQATRDSELFVFRARLQAAVAARDAPAVLRMSSAEVVLSFGIDDGPGEFKRRLANPRHELWTELATVLALGGTFQTPTSFVAPYPSSCSHEFGELVVIGADVNVRSAPSLRAPVVMSVSFALLKGQLGYEGDEWAEVDLPGGRKGHIAAAYVRSGLDKRAYLGKLDGSWRLTAFIGGD